MLFSLCRVEIEIAPKTTSLSRPEFSWTHGNIVRTLIAQLTSPDRPLC
jgi:hypothetical protein